MFKKRMDRAQDSLKCFLEKAQDRGFLHLIIGDRENVDGDGSPNCIQSAGSSPAMSSSSNPFAADLQPLIDQAKLHGWYIEPHEVSLQLILRPIKNCGVVNFTPYLAQGLRELNK